MAAKSRQELQAEVERLRGQIQEQEQQIVSLRRREQGCRALMGAASDSLFEVSRAAGAAREEARVQFYGASAEAATAAATDVERRQQQLARLIRWEQFVEYQNEAAATGAPVSFSFRGGAAQEAMAQEARAHDALRLSLVAFSSEEGGVQLMGTACREPGSTVPGGVHLEEATCRTIIDDLAPPLLLFNGEGELCYLNRAARELASVEQMDEAAGWTLSELLPALALFDPSKDDPLEEGGRAEREAVWHVPGGAHVHVLARPLAVTMEGRPATMVALHPDGEQPARAGARPETRGLSETRDLFEAVFRLSPALMVVVRLGDGRVLDANDAFCQMTGYAREELLMKTWAELGLWVRRPRRAALIERVVAGERVEGEQVHVRRRDGSVHTAVTSARAGRLQGERCILISAIDVTERERAARAERESRTLLRRLFHVSPAAISITRVRDGHVLEINRAFCQILGYDREALVGRTTLEAGIWADPNGRADLVRRIARQEGLHDYEMDVRTRGGERRTMLFSMQRVTVGGEACIISVGADITLRKQAEQALVEAKERAEEAARFRTSIFTNMTHEVRTPLTVILGFTSMLRQGVRDEYRRFVHLIERSGRRLLLTLDSVLDLAQLEAGTLEVDQTELNVLDLVHYLVEEHQAPAEERGLELTLLPAPPANVYAWADYDLLGRVLSHLIDNAIKFTRAGTVSVGVRAEEGRAYIDVHDTGIGIDEAFMTDLFESFSQESTGLARTHQGSGLGLTVSKQIVERLGGRLRAVSERGSGSTFTIELPQPTRPSPTSRSGPA